MKISLFYIWRILATVILIAALSLIGIGNPKVVPIFALFFIAIFALVYYLNKQSQTSEREVKSGSALKPVLRIVGLVIFVGAFSLLGLIHGILGFIVFFAVISLIVALVFLYIRKRQRHFELTTSNPRSKQMLSIVMAALAVLVPLLIIRFEIGRAHV